jgi:hypothetical protein
MNWGQTPTLSFLCLTRESLRKEEDCRIELVPCMKRYPTMTKQEGKPVPKRDGIEVLT